MEALQNETMIRQELAAIKPDIMNKQVFRCFVTYYEEILKIQGTSGSPNVQVFKRKFKAVEEATGEEQGEAELGDANPVLLGL